jgi:hypothetical protein
LTGTQVSGILVMERPPRFGSFRKPIIQGARSFINFPPTGIHYPGQGGIDAVPKLCYTPIRLQEEYQNS